MKYKIPLITAGIVGVVAVTGIVMANQQSCDAKSCQPQASQTSQKQKSKIDKINDELNDGALLVDVRTPEEFAEGHARKAINLPYDQIVTGIYPTEDKDTKIYVYCRSGKRAGIALDALKDAGYTKTASVTSLDNWQKLGGSVVR